VSKKPTQKPSVSPAEDEAVVVFIDGNYFVYSAGQGIRLIARKDDKRKADKHIEPLTDLGLMMDRPRDLIVHFLDAMDAVKVSTQSRIGKIKTVDFGISVPRRTKEKAIDEMIARAAGVLGSREEGMRWLGTPVRGLDFATPISLLGTPEGVERVNDVLGQIEHGVW
jgi:hypothetical protein